MQLLYRGNPYEASTHSSAAPTSSTLKSTPKVRLIYRGNTYEYTPQPKQVLDALRADVQTITLIYRGQTYQRQVLAVRSYQQPRALNWRWQYPSPQS